MLFELSLSCSNFSQCCSSFFFMLLKPFLILFEFFLMLLECCPMLLDFACCWSHVLYVAGILFHIAWIFLMLLDFLFVCFKILLQYSRITFNSVGDKLKTPLQYSRITFNLVGEKIKNPPTIFKGRLQRSRWKIKNLARSLKMQKSGKNLICKVRGKVQ